MTLKDRLQFELIGPWQTELTQYERDNATEDRCYADDLVSARNRLRTKQTASMAPTIANIEADLKGLLPEELPTSEEDRSMMAYHYTRTGFNDAIRQVEAAIERYTRGEA